MVHVFKRFSVAGAVLKWSPSMHVMGGVRNTLRSYQYQRHATGLASRTREDPGENQSRMGIRATFAIAAIAFGSLSLAFYLFKPFLYPWQVRQHLRDAVSAEHKLKKFEESKNLKTEPGSKEDTTDYGAIAVESYLKAIKACVDGGIPEDSMDVLGIMFRLGDAYRSVGKFGDSVEVLDRALRLLLNDPDDDLRMIRAVGTANLLGDVLKTSGNLGKAREYYEWAIRAMLGDLQQIPGGSGPPPVRSTSTKRPQTVLTSSPTNANPPPLVPEPWATTRDLGGSLEALGNITDDNSIAITLLFRALQLASPPHGDPLPKDEPKEVPMCRSAVLLNNIAERYVRMGDIEKARGWALRAVELAERGYDIEKNRSGKKPGEDTCLEAAMWSSHGLAAVLEMRANGATQAWAKEENTREAKVWYNRALELAAECRENDVKKSSVDGLRRLISIQ
ncbi:hypothetical protein BJ742DRAFT_868294 [Cladochytrium replicatum]|nr:hypothetical protein BJ742DRAFT_868294 [Cladochytrium replicatum]